MRRILLTLFFLAASVLACDLSSNATPTIPSRLESLPTTNVKGSPETDPWKPIVAEGWTDPLPLPYPLNTSGGEDSPFITSDDQRLYFFFTPDVSIPAEKQLTDGLSGIWVSQRSGEEWTVPERVLLQKKGEVALDGCAFVLGEEMWFCSARKGNYRSVDLYRATFQEGKWSDWRNAGKQLNMDYQAGEMHLSADRQELYFASQRAGGFGGYDLWVTQRTGNGWGEPTNLGGAVNTPNDENRPFLSQDGNELWFDAPSHLGKIGPAIFVANRQQDGTWGEPTEVVSQFAGEATLSGDGKTLYFVHFFFTADMDRMLDADIYVTTRP